MTDIASTKVTNIVQMAGGKIVGRTKLQKIAYILKVTGLEESFKFSYKHYGPYSEDFAATVEMEVLFDKLLEEERPARWGGTYSIYEVNPTYNAEEQETHTNSRAAFEKVAKLCAQQNSIELEIAATAILLSEEGYDPWKETCDRKPNKATDERIPLAKNFLKELSEIDLPKAIPSNVL